MRPAPAHTQWKAHLCRHLEGGEAFTPLKTLLDGVGYEQVGKRLHGLPYSIFELFYHIAYAQRDILYFCTDPAYAAPSWPGDYWPENKAPASRDAWLALRHRYFTEREALKNVVGECDLLNSVPSDTKKTYLREMLLVIEHTAYHTGQLAVLLRLQKDLDK